MNDFKYAYRKFYDSIDVTEGFSEKTIDKVIEVAERKNQRYSGKQRKAIVAFAALLVVIVLFAGTAFAVNRWRQVRLSESAEFSSATNEYAQSVGQSVEHGGLTLTLTETIYENNKLYVIYNYTAEPSLDLNFISGMDSVLVIDGEQILCNWFSTSSISADGVTSYREEYNLGSDDRLGDNGLSQGDHDVAILANTIEIICNDGTEKMIEGSWSFEFSLKVGDLEDMTTTYRIDEELTLPNGDAIILDEIVSTPTSQRLWFRVIPAEKNDFRAYDVSAEAIDTQGNKYLFVFSEGSMERCESVNIYPDAFSESAESIKLSIIISDRDGNIILKCEKPIMAYRNM